jgi:hypothetical protein
VPADIQEVTCENFSLTNIENAPPTPSPVFKEDTNVQLVEGGCNVEGVATTSIEQQSQSLRPEKLSFEEGFCCVINNLP